MPHRRSAYVAALRGERAAIAARPDPDELRLAAIDSELDRFADEPDVASVERAVPGPISRSRNRHRGGQDPAQP